MNRINNQKLIKIINGNRRFIIIGIIFVIVSFGLFYLGSEQSNKDDKNIIHLNELIEGRSDNKTGVKAYLDIKYLSPKVVVYDDTSDAYYYAFDGTYYYLVYMHEDEANSLLNKDLESDPVKITGVSKSIPKDVSTIAVDAYNKYFISETDDKINYDRAFEVFGDVYLDTTDSFSALANVYMFGGIFFIFLGFILGVVGVIFIIRIKKNINAISDDELSIIQREMEDYNCKYYCYDKLCLTNNYIVMLDGRFKAYRYTDILWIYPFEQYTNGVRTSKAIKIASSDGKTNIIANMVVATPNQKAVYEEIWNAIISKNSNMRIGYLPENITYYNEIIKKNK